MANHIQGASALIPFSFESHAVRVILRDNQPWFVAADVCEALELRNTRQVVSRLDDDEKATVHNPAARPGDGAQAFNVINESGLYALIFTSRKAAAKRFRKWVTAEVLPAIRQRGRYEHPVVAALPAAPVSPVERGTNYPAAQRTLGTLYRDLSQMLPPEHYQAIHPHLRHLHDCFVWAWTEMDEAQTLLTSARGYLRRWKGSQG